MKLIASPAARAAALRTGKLELSVVAPAPPIPSVSDEAVAAVEALLRERFPEVFRTPRPPLAIGVYEQILVAGGDIDVAALKGFLRCWVRKYDYLDAVAHGEARLNLDGTAAGRPSADQQRCAATRVYGAGRGAVVLARLAARDQTRDKPAAA
jgi:sRNA-binding protein